jgi:glycosyltransferase involved in cell wall biosynthesis
MPRVLIIPDYDTYGGTLSFLLKLLKFHQQHKLETAVLIPKSQASSKMLETFQATQVKVYVGTDRSRWFYKPYVSLLYDLIFCWRAYWAFRPDLIVISTGAFDLLWGVLIYPVPVILAMHTYPPAEIKTKKRVGLRWFGWLMGSWTKNRFMTVSNFAANNIRQNLGIPLQAFKVIYNSYGEVVQANRPKEKIVLTLGHVVPYKNPATWLKVAQQVLVVQPEVKFIWLGEGACLEALRQKVCALGLEHQIKLPGYCDAVSDHYQKAMIYFQPSLVESHGIAVVEAMAYGLPCLTSNAGGLPESVIDGETGFTCPPEDIDGFSRYLLELLDKSDLREKLGRAGQRRAQTLFSEPVQEREVMALYKSLAPQRMEQA